jgi:predicted RNA-binding protein YlqC (UPF0109 family)
MIAHVLVNKPEAVAIQMTALNGAHTIRLTVDPADKGQLIGKQGRTVKAIRVVLAAAAKKENIRVLLETL